jgi:hypothetical protein
VEAHDEGEDKMTGPGAVQVPTAGRDDVLVMSRNTGTVVSWAVAHERAADGVTTRRLVGIIELDEGPRWWTSITGADPGEDLFGRRVQVAFAQVGGGEAIPYFTVTEETRR